MDLAGVWQRALYLGHISHGIIAFVESRLVDILLQPGENYLQITSLGIAPL
jgi:hypothetical protein